MFGKIRLLKRRLLPLNPTFQTLLVITAQQQRLSSHQQHVVT
jgi:hypothetical protein